MYYREFYRNCVFIFFTCLLSVFSSVVFAQESDTAGIIRHKKLPTKRYGFIANKTSNDLKGDTIYLNNITDTVDVDSLNIEGLTFLNKKFKAIEFQLNYDTVFGDVEFNNTLENKAPSEYFFLDVEDCYLDNNSLNVASLGRFQKIKFNYCTFNTKVRWLQLRADTVTFINCKFLHNNITLEILPNKKKVFLELYRTDIDNIRFTYPESMELIFIRDTAYEIQKTVYQRLLSKFKTEGKDLSYKFLDIDYRLWDAKDKSYFGRLGVRLDRVWWNFGYSKGRIVAWTFLFLTIFCFFNLWLWEKMQAVYPIIAKTEASDNQKSFKQKLRKLVKVIVFTSLIFFSLKVDFDKLSFKSSRLLFYFFIQYMIGLVCVFFIVNAILKF
jgi:hypothetical protein